MKVLRLVMALVRGLRESVGLRQFYELLVIAVREVKQRESWDTHGDELRPLALSAIRTVARRRGDLDPKDRFINLAIEVALMLVRTGLDWLIQPEPTKRYVDPQPPLRAAIALLMLATAVAAHGASVAGRNQSCATVPCDPKAAVRLYCTADETSPFDGPAAGGQCKECAGSTFNAAKCASSPPTTTPTTPTSTPSTTRPSTTIPPTTPSTTLPPPSTLNGPIRPSPRDRSIKKTVRRPDDLKWAQLGTMPHTASQPERDYYEHQRVLDAHQITMAAQSVLGCRSAVTKCYGNISDVDAKLGSEYEERGLCRGNVWEVPEDGRHYSFTRYCLEGLRACLLSSGEACAARFTSDRPTLDILDMDVRGGRCVPSAPFAFGPLPRFDAKREDLAPVDTRMRLPAPTGTLLTKLHATHKAHNAACLAECGVPTEPSMVSAQIAHVQYEAECFAQPGTAEQKERRLHFCQVKPFLGAFNPRWSKDERCAWCKIEHAFHGCWADGQETGDWGLTRRCDTDHAVAHRCANDGDDRQLVLFSCSEHPCNPIQCPAGPAKRGPMTCREALPVLIERLKLGTPATLTKLGELEGGPAVP